MVPDSGFANRQRKVAVVWRRWWVALGKSGQCEPNTYCHPARGFPNRRTRRTTSTLQ
jgi:hypothetical protein